ATLSLNSIVTLETALDGAGLNFTTGGTGQPWQGQQAVTHDGADAAQTGTVGNSTYTWIKSTVQGPATLTFWWKVSSEKDRDYLRFMLDAADQMRISGEVDWQPITFNVPSGTHELQWRYSKNSSSAAGQDRGWLDQVQVTTPPGGPSPSPLPTIAAMEPAVILSGDEALLTWNSDPGTRYQVLYKDELSDADWTLLAGGIEATDATCTLTDNGQSPRRFYQVVED
ncbi:MAG TPA: hypothetical protein VK530_18600, partial [Candidatus Acidoferrum sp.]|nr:hypothetical protein [Candidatus Acidoferrum sp.]